MYLRTSGKYCWLFSALLKLGRTDMTDDRMKRLQRLEKLSWLADVPLFIDDTQVGRFHDAVVRPNYQLTKVIENVSDEKLKELKGSLEIDAKAEFSLPAYLQILGLKADAEVGAKAGGELKRASSAKQSEERELSVIASPERQLEDLTTYYLLHHRDRIIFNDGPLQGELAAGKEWFHYELGVADKVPRALAFLDLSKGIRLIPTAAEFENGKIVLLYQSLHRRLTDETGGPKERYPDDLKKDHSALRRERQDYWSSFDNRFDPRKAMVVIEEAASDNGRLNWIDYRLPLSPDGDTLHLHICPKGRYDAGVFGYNFVTRGFKHGLRLVGTLKSEPDMNVLAVYEK